MAASSQDTMMDCSRVFSIGSSLSSPSDSDPSLSFFSFFSFSSPTSFSDSFLSLFLDFDDRFDSFRMLPTEGGFCLNLEIES